MQIETKFKINDLIQHKHQKPSALRRNIDFKFDIKFFEILYIHSETCTAGTQVFYKCRPFFPIVSSSFKEEEKLIDLGFGMIAPNNEGLIVFREDEVKLMSDDERKFYGVE